MALGKGKGKGKNKGKSPIECFNCGGNHLARKCPYPHKGKGKSAEDPWQQTGKDPWRQTNEQQPANQQWPSNPPAKFQWSSTKGRYQYQGYCSLCGKFGHSADRCWGLQANMSKGKGKDTDKGRGKGQTFGKNNTWPIHDDVPDAKRKRINFFGEDEEEENDRATGGQCLGCISLQSISYPDNIDNLNDEIELAREQIKQLAQIVQLDREEYGWYNGINEFEPVDDNDNYFRHI